MDRDGPPSPLRAEPAFRALWIGRITSFAGDQLTLVALTLHVHAVHGTGHAVAMLLLAGAAPRLLGPVAGAIADRVGQRRLMRVCELVRASVIVTIAATLPALPLLLGLVAVAVGASGLGGASSAPSTPARWSGIWWPTRRPARSSRSSRRGSCSWSRGSRPRVADWLLRALPPADGPDGPP